MKKGTVSLYRYYLIMRHMQSRFIHELGSGDWIDRAEANPQYLPFLIAVDPPSVFLNQWQASLYVVIEGWRELGLSDPDIDTLLASSNLEALRLHRNGTFHYQKELIPDRYRKLLNSPDAVTWVNKLSDAFKAYFDKVLLNPAFRQEALSLNEDEA